MDRDYADMLVGQALDRSYGGASPATLKEDTPVLVSITQRLAMANDAATIICATLADFLGRCGRGNQGEGAASPTKPHEVGHVGAINQGLDELEDRIRFLTNLANRISQIG